jgi:SNF2 family DNA or RNA helicase
VHGEVNLMRAHAGQLVMHVDRPEVILNAIPGGRIAPVNGNRFVVVPHTADVVKVLRNLGLDPPLIDLDSFHYTGRHQPFKHQIYSTKFLVTHKRAFNLSDMGTGKTKSALWAAEYLMQQGFIKRIIIACPLSVVSVWEEEAWNTVPHRSISRLLGARERRLDLMKKGAEICVINHDGLTTIEDAIGRANFDLLIVDEASAYRNASTRRYKRLKRLTVGVTGEFRPIPWLWLMTGTPTPKAPTDAYGLIKLVNPGSFLSGFGVFKEITMMKVADYKWIPRPIAKEYVFQHLQPAIRFKKSDCLDLPPVTHVNRNAELTEQQQKAYKLMKARMVMEQHDGERITAANAAVKLLKLLQICCGVIKDNAGKHYQLECNKRLDVLDETIQEAGGKAIVFIPFLGVMSMVERDLQKRGYKTGLVNGEVGFTARTKIFDDFQRGDTDVLIAHPRTAAHGLNLTASSTIIWYAPIFSAEQYLQANNRIDRPGQTQHMTIAHIIATPMEAGLYRALWGQVSMQQAILEQYEGLMK